MTTAYEKQTWTPGSSPLSSSRMSHIEDGIADSRLVGECIFAPVVLPGFLALDGSELSRTGSFSRLFDWADAEGLIGSFFGPGDGSTTFTLPDFRERFPRGVPAAGTVGNVGGSESHGHASGGNTGSAGGHAHSQPSTASAGAHAHSNPATGAAGSHDHAFSGATTSPAGSHSHSFSDSFVTGGPSSLADTQVGVSGAAHATHSHSGSVSGTTGSGGNHTHTLDVNDMTDEGSHSHSQSDTGSGGNHSHSNPNTASAPNHSHTVPQVDETTTRPPYIDVIWQIRT